MDDHSIPEETKIYYSVTSTLIGLGGSIGVIVLGIFIAVDTHEYIGSTLTTIFGFVLLWFTYKRSKNKAPQIIINKLGIETAAAGFYPWTEIGNEIVTREMRDKDELICLEYDCPNGHEEFNIGDMDIKPDDLAVLLVTYRERSGQKYKYDKNYLGLNKSADYNN
ncbi:hypothetical protein ACFGVR_14740 [Mucilaginibacter sp. AW1-3]